MSGDTHEAANLRLNYHNQKILGKKWSVNQYAFLINPANGSARPKKPGLIDSMRATSNRLGAIS
jgi:hypothetical protein